MTTTHLAALPSSMCVARPSLQSRHGSIVVQIQTRTHSSRHQPTSATVLPAVPGLTDGHIGPTPTFCACRTDKLKPQIAEHRLLAAPPAAVLMGLAWLAPDATGRWAPWHWRHRPVGWRALWLQRMPQSQAVSAARATGVCSSMQLPAAYCSRACL